MTACQSGDLEDVQTILDELKTKNIDVQDANQKTGVNIQDADGNSGLHLAASGGHLPVVEFLVSEGADVNTTNDDNETALTEAAFSGHLEVCQYLVSNGADVTVESEFGTALELAEEEGHDAIVDLLKFIM